MLRRDWLAALPVGALLASCGRLGKEEQADLTEPSPAGVGRNKLEAFGLQLSTLTPLLMADFEGTLAQVASIGYRQVEFSALGFLGRPVETVARLLEQHGLSAPVGRISPKLPDGFGTLSREEQFAAFQKFASPEYLTENVHNALRGAKELGQRHLVLPALMPEAFSSREKIDANIDLLRRVGEICANSGVQFGYHNHDWEFKPVDGVVPYDLMLESIEPELMAGQLDVYWVTKAGRDPDEYLKSHPNRFPTCHLKDIDANGDFEDVGYGQIDMPGFVSSAMASGTQYYFVERDNPPHPLQTAKRAYQYLEQMTY